MTTASENGPTSAPQWYYARNNQRVGPLSSAQLKALAAAGTLTPADRVLRVGTKKWVPAAKVKGLFPVTPSPSTPPPPPSPCVLAPAKVAGPLFSSRHELLSDAQVVPDAARCVQCGCCSYNCPIGIDVRAHAWRGQPIHDSHCLTCGECVKRCPRSVLAFERLSLLGE
jgi:Fe-S oxidoreductase